MTTTNAKMEWWKDSIIARTFREFLEDDCPRMAAALAYYIIFALPPLLVLIMMAVGFFMDPNRAADWIQGQMSPDAADQVDTMIRNASERVAGGFSIGVVLGLAGVIFSATGALAQLQKALNRSWGVERDPEMKGVGAILFVLMKRLMSLAMVVVIAILLIVAMSISGLISAFSAQITSFLAPVGVPAGSARPLAWTADAVVSLIIVTLVFAAMLKVLPDVRTHWKDVWVGAFVTAILFVIGKMLIGWYIGRSNPGEAFGAAAALAAILVFVYYASMIVLLGAQFTQVWAHKHGRGIRPSKHAVRLVTEKRHVRE